jgi:RNA polymerase sigma factor (sigma-70 family)
MTSARNHPILNYLRRALRTSESAGVSDAELLRRFVTGRDEAAFELLLWRHAAMVLHVCRQILRDEGAAEDAFQATFLVLSRKAESISRRESVGGWLHRVAYRIALKARASLRKTRAAVADLDGVEAVPDAEDPSQRELRRVLCEEINRLPAKYRAPIIACYYESRTHEEAADQLGWPRGTVAGRLSRAREMLRRRLMRRGVALTASALAATMTVPSAPAALAELVEATIRTTKLFAANGPLSPVIAALAEGVLRTMFWTRVKIVMAVLLIAGLGGAGATFLSAPTSQAEPPGGSDQRDGEARSAGVDAAGDADPQKPDDAARLAQNMALSRRNLKELALAMQNYADAHRGRMLAPAIYGKDGKALLSWRVELLHFLNESALYNQFKRDEPWDSPHNKQLLSKMPKVYAPPGVRTRQPYSTYYQVFVSAGAEGRGGGVPGGGAGMSGAAGVGSGMIGGAGGPPTLPGTGGAPGGPGGGRGGAGAPGMLPGGYSPPLNSAAFVKGQGVPFPAHFTDGTSNTLLIVEAGNAVPWTKPEDLHYAADEPLPELGGLFPDVFHAAFADGAVHTLTKKYDETQMRAAITAGAGEILDLAKIEIPRQVKAPEPREAQRQLGREGERLQQLLRINEKMLQESKRRDEVWNRLLDEKQKILEAMLEDIKRSRNPDERRPLKPIEKKQPLHK